MICKLSNIWLSLTLKSTGKEICINSQNICAIVNDGGYARIDTNNNSYLVNESYEKIMKMWEETKW